MAISHLLEDFSHAKQSPDAYRISEDVLEDARLAAFESGYQAGWDDASAAHATDQNQLLTDLSQNLQALSFTYHEAYRHILAAVQPLLKQMVATVLPDLAQATLGHRVVSEVSKMAANHVKPELELTMSSATRSQVEVLLNDGLNMPVRLLDDDSLGPGQVLLKLEQEERKIDMAGLLVSIETAVTGFLTMNEGSKADG
jgi:flagellar biosynthesis/type III secretory pathway protein FliH